MDLFVADRSQRHDRHVKRVQKRIAIVEEVIAGRAADHQGGWDQDENQVAARRHVPSPVRTYPSRLLGCGLEETLRLLTESPLFPVWVSEEKVHNALCGI